MTEKIIESFSKLSSYCATENYKGFDPFDGLNSTCFQAIPFLKNSRLARLVWLQFFKKFPINLRSFVGIGKDYNPKALGLFLSGYCNLEKPKMQRENLDKINFFTATLEKLANTEYSGICWGYNFDWQAVAFYHPRHTPTIVSTSFIANGFLDAFEVTSDEAFLKIARSACDFVINDLNRTYDNNGNFCFSYSPLDTAVVYNASFLGSSLLARVYSYTRESHLLTNASQSVEYCCNDQNMDGSWRYGRQENHQWIDNFHTGYNLVSLSEYMKHSGDNRFRGNLEKGFDFYINTFFTSEGISKYYNNSIYPVDIHSPAQLILTLTKLGKFDEFRDIADKVILWTINKMQSQKGYFYYQKNKSHTNKISYMRWAQAWMFYAMSEYLLYAGNNDLTPFSYED